MTQRKPICLYDVWVTFYGFDDNDDGQGHYGTATIAYPGLHKVATEDEGSYENPSTFATDKRFLKPGTRLYIPRLLKYCIMEDNCRACTDDWNKGNKHVDLYIGGSIKPGGRALEYREIELTLDKPEIVIVHPPKNLPIADGPLFTGNI